VKAWSADAPYVARLQGAAPADRYRVYLDMLPDWRAASAFYLDAAEVFFAAGEPALAMRILSNLAEMNLENRELLRILGYRLTQAGAPDLAIPVFEEVLRLAPDEPQSYRDLGLAHAQAGQDQKAVDLLWETVSRPWDGRFPDIEMTALAELNALLATSKGPLDRRAVDARLLRNLPLDARVVLSWDTDNTDIDLWVTDPNGEKAFYGHPLTYQGGRMSRDFTGGYGPEEFALKHAKAGTYRIQAHFYGNRRQVLSGATTLSVKLYSHFGTPRQTEKLVTLRLDKARDAVDIGDFEVGAGR
jgi:tetratricopeptide (TPR) repeat protein